MPAFVTAFGLIFAVLTERVRWAVAFKTIVFLPMAISAFATGVTWRIMYQQDPNVGAINALGRVGVDAVSSPGVLSERAPVDADAHRRQRRRARPEDPTAARAASRGSA